LQRRARERGLAPPLRDPPEVIPVFPPGWGGPRGAGGAGPGRENGGQEGQGVLAGGGGGPARPPPRGRPRPADHGPLGAAGGAAAGGERTWSAPQLARWLAETHGVRVRPSYLAQRLRQRRFRWKRTKRTVQHKADPDRQEQARADLAVLTF